MTIRTCKICGATSVETAFYAGVNSRCAECHKSKVRENRAENVDRYRAYDAKRAKEDPRVKARNLRYIKTPEGKARATAARKRWILKNEDKRAAHVILGNAVRYGRVAKPRHCSKCCAGGQIEGHHHDYTKPLDVKWLCTQCHVSLHKEINAAVTLI